MTSRRTCYVYLQLPGSLEMVTCGRYEREILPSGGAVGRFVYGRRYRSRSDAVPLDPFGLPLTDQVIETARLRGVHGALRDAAPDAWGRLVIDRALGRSDLDELDYLLHGPEDRAGALSFGLGKAPPPPVRAFNRVVRLADLREAARRIENGESQAAFPEQLRSLISPGTSLGGARPKAVIEDRGGLWIAKFPERSDRWNNAAVEGALLSLARRCGIQVPPLRLEVLGDESVLLVKRFDRERVAGGYRRHRVLSGLTVLDAEEDVTDRGRWSYLLLADELQRRSAHATADKVELFRRAAFNALVSNGDDHPRNHALVARGASWQLAPAYDLTPQPSTSQERNLALVAGHHGRRATRGNLTSAAARFGLSAQDAGAIVDGIKATVAGEWEAEVRRLHGTSRDCDLVRSAFSCDGFEYAGSGGP